MMSIHDILGVLPNNTASPNDLNGKANMRQWNGNVTHILFGGSGAKKLILHIYVVATP